MFGERFAARKVRGGRSEVRRERSSAAGVFLLLVVVLVGMVPLLAGCGWGDLAGSPQVDEARVTDEAAELTETTVSASSESAGEESLEPARDSVSGGVPDDGARYSSGAAGDLDRKIISNAKVQVEVEEGGFQPAFDQALLLADKYGGYIIASESYASEEEQSMRRGMISLRVPAESLNRALRDLGDLGTVTSRRVETEDVTGEFVDLEARLKNAEAQEQSLLELMSEAETVEDTLQVQRVLSNTRAEIEQLKGRLNYLEEHTDYSTLTLTLYEPGSTANAQRDWGFMRAWRNAAEAFVSTLNSLIVGLGGALPVLVIFFLILWGVYRLAAPAVRRAQESSGSSEAGAHREEEGDS